MKMEILFLFLAFCGCPPCRPLTRKPITYLFVRYPSL